MGTTYTVKAMADTDAAELSTAIKEAAEKVNQLMSNWIEDSDISRFNQLAVGESMEIAPETALVLQRAADIHELTHKAFDPTLSPLIELWGFGTKERVSFPSDADIAAVLDAKGMSHLQLEGTRLTKTGHEVKLNLGAIAKGFGVDYVAQTLESRGISRYYVEIGGEVRVSGQSPGDRAWRIGIEDPKPSEGRQIFKIVEVRGGAVATSGDYRKFFEHEGRRYSHILDPRTGKPKTSKIVSASVFAPDCMTADALATAFMILTPEEALNLVNNESTWECLIFVEQENGELQPFQSKGMSHLLLDPESLDDEN